MGTIKTKGIIIAEHNMGDFDKMVTILTPGLGKISCAAKGSKKNKSPLMAGSQFLCFSDYVLYQSPSSYYMNSCEPIEAFYKIRTDFDKLTYASFITKIINDVTDENENSYRILQLFLNTLYVIAETDKDLDFILSIFKIKLVSIIGYAPRIFACTNCNSKENLKYFSIKDSGLKCDICARQDTSCIELREGTKSAIKYIVLSNPKKIYSFKISEDSKNELEYIAKIYLNEKLEKDYSLSKMF